MRSAIRFPLLGAAIVVLTLGIWGGLLRIGWRLPAAHPDLVVWHGPLMVFGFLGTVISLERAVALRRWWGYLAPAGTLLGVLLLLTVSSPRPAELALLVAGLVLLGLFAVIVSAQPTPATATLALGAGLWVAGVLLWLAGVDLQDVIPWWAGFLVLTIVGERLELAALGRLDARGRFAFDALLAVLVAGLATTTDRIGGPLTGVAFVGLAVWLFRFDIARRTVHRPGLPRFVACSLLPGYAWLAVAGVLWMTHGAGSTGLLRDAQLHALFVGFVFSMIFGHAPVIFPGVLGIRIPFRRVFYIHLAVLHAGLLVRVAGDLANDEHVARDGALVVAIAIGLFFVATVASGAVAAFAAAGGRRALRERVT